MHTKGFYRIFRLSLLYASLLGSGPFLFDPKKKIVYTPNWVRWRCRTTHVTFFLIFLFYSSRTLQLQNEGGPKKDQYFIISYGFSFVVILELIGLCLWDFMPAEQLLSLNFLLRYAQNFQRKFHMTNHIIRIYYLGSQKKHRNLI
jgi:hypothetical protein